MTEALNVHASMSDEKSFDTRPMAAPYTDSIDQATLDILPAFALHPHPQTILTFIRKVLLWQSSVATRPLLFVIATCV